MGEMMVISILHGFQFCNSPYHDVGVQPVLGELSVAQLSDIKVFTCSYDVHCHNG